MDNSEAMLELAKIYFLDRGDTVDEAKALAYLEKAVKLNNKCAIATQANAYYTGILGKVDFDLAASLYYLVIDDFFDAKDKLKELATAGNTKAEAYLIVSHCAHQHFKKAKKRFDTHPVKINEQLFLEANKLIVDVDADKKK